MGTRVPGDGQLGIHAVPAAGHAAHEHRPHGADPGRREPEIPGLPAIAVLADQELTALAGRTHGIDDGHRRARILGAVWRVMGR